MSPASCLAGADLGACLGLVLLALLSACALRPSALPPPAAVQLQPVPFWPQTQFQCGPAALASVLNHSGIAVTPSELQGQVYLPGRRGSLQSELLAAPRDYGRIAYRLPGTTLALHDNLAQGHPVLVLLNQGWRRFPLWHYAVVTGLNNGHVTLHSGKQRDRKMSWRQFARQWQKADFWALTVRPPEQLPAGLTASALLNQLASLEQRFPRLALPAYQAARHRWPQHPALLFASATAHLRLGQPVKAQQLLDQLLQKHPDDIAAGNNLALALLARGRPDEAYSLIATWLDQLPATSPWRPAMLDTLQQIEAHF